MPKAGHSFKFRLEIGWSKLGVSADNILDSNAPPHLVQELLEARLERELSRKTASAVSGKELFRDWKLLQQARNVEGKEMADSFTPRPLPIPASVRPTKPNLP